MFYYHPDHLGSSSYITDANGEVSQHVEYFAFGETFLEEHSNTDSTPYLFNGKELDEETGLYYYGARYYDAKTSVWQSVDPPVLGRYLDGLHNGGVYNSFNLGVYNYTYQNPIRFVDPDGRQVEISNPIGERIVNNYNSSTNKNPGGDCYAVAKSRFAVAFKEVMGTSHINSLPNNVSKLSFNKIFNSATGQYRGWTSLPLNSRGKGGAGAIAMAGFGELQTQSQVWSGELTPGAIVQVWTSTEGYNEVVTGARDIDGDGYVDYEGYGHSFIFLNYQRDDKGAIIGMNIADQGYQSYLEENDYSVWHAANITTKPREKVKPITPIKTERVKLIKTEISAPEINPK